MDFGDFLEQKLGTRKWCIFSRMTQRLRDRGYEIAVTPKRYKALMDEFRRAHPTPEVKQLRAMMQLPGVTAEMALAGIMAIDALDQRSGRL